MRIKLQKLHECYYRTEDGKLVSFQNCIQGKYKGKNFMCVYYENMQSGYMNPTELYFQEVLEVIHCHAESRNKLVLDEVEVSGRKLSRAEVFRNMARKTMFCLNAGTGYSGYTFDEQWNNWELPYFTKEVADSFCEEFSGLYCTEKNERLFYNELEDAYFVEDKEGNYEEVGHPTEIPTQDGRVKVYNFGFSCWCWEEK